MGFADGHVKWLKTKAVVDEARKPIDLAANRPFAGGAWRPGNP
jgi:hypothetical protein